MSKSSIARSDPGGKMGQVGFHGWTAAAQAVILKVPYSQAHEARSSLLASLRQLPGCRGPGAMEGEVRNLKHTQNAHIEHPGKLGETQILGGATRAYIPALLKTLLRDVGVTRLPLLF